MCFNYNCAKQHPQTAYGSKIQIANADLLLSVCPEASCATMKELIKRLSKCHADCSNLVCVARICHEAVLNSSYRLSHILGLYMYMCSNVMYFITKRKGVTCS